MTIAALAVSTVFIAFISIAASIARKLVIKVTNDNFLRELFYEGIAAAELCGCCFELIISKYYMMICCNFILAHFFFFQQLTARHFSFYI